MTSSGERLIRIETKIDDLKLDFENHLTDHKKYLYMAWTTAMGMITTLAILIIKLV